MAAADEDDGIVRRDRIEILAIRQAMFRELRFVPVAVADDDVAGTARLDARGDGREHVGDRSRTRQIDAGSAAGIVKMPVGEPGNHGLAVQIDRRRPGPASFLIAASAPTAVKRPPVIAIACAIENDRSTVTTCALTRIVSAGRCGA